MPSNDPRLERWLRAVVVTPGLTGITDVEEARRTLLEDSLRAADVVRAFGGPIVDVGAGGGAPGIPLAAVLPEREITLLEASRRKSDFLRDVAREFPNVRVVRGRAEEQRPDAYAVALAKALAPPRVAAEWTLALVRPGGAAVLFAGRSVDSAAVARVAARLGGGEPEERDGLLVIPKVAATPAGFPRRPGIARKRPLA